MDLLFSPKMKEKFLNRLVKLIPFNWIKFLLPNKFILYGHVISDNEHFVKRIYNYPSFNEFDELSTVLMNLGYAFVDLQEYLKEDSKKKILLTIDDGFKIVKDEMHIKLKERRIPYVLFINTLPLDEPGFIFSSLINKSGLHVKNRPAERLFLSTEEILELKSDGVYIGFHTQSHQLIKEDFNLTKSKEVDIEERFSNLFSKPLVFSYPYYAPENYLVINKIIQGKTHAQYFFDTKGFNKAYGNHHFRVSIDSCLSLKERNNSIYMVKRQLLQSFYHGNNGKGLSAGNI